MAEGQGNFFTKIFSRKSSLKEIDSEKSNIIGGLSMSQPRANYSPWYPPISHVYYTGEKTAGEMGSPKNYSLHYTYLRTRSWQAFLESDIAGIIIKRFCKWTIGNGLKLQPEPEETVLKQEGINFMPDDFIKQTEARFSIWSNSLSSDYKELFNLNKLAYECLKNAYVGGDCLVVQRIDENNNLSIELIDGEHVQTPIATTFINDATSRGNKICHGVELNKKNQHVAYYVLGENMQYTRIERYGKESNTLQAYLVYGSIYRIDNVRGLPLLSAVLETIKKLDRYKEATVGSAEERQKIAFAIEHGVNSTGSNPFSEKLVQATKLGLGEQPETKTETEYETAATKIAATTNKQVVSLPIDATLKSLESKNELYFKEFFDTNVQYLCASVGIPYEVALSMFNSNYSASRAAIKDWEHTLKVERTNFSDQFYQPVYNTWLEIQILTNKIQAQGYLKAMMTKNIYAIESYRKARFIGLNVPHIDPLKEVMAERLKLGDDITPLTDYDQATESLGSGDFMEIIRHVKNQIKVTEGLPVKKETSSKPMDKEDDEDEDEKETKKKK